MVRSEGGEDQMVLKRYRDARDFLAVARQPLELNEAANSLIVGVAGRVAEDPDHYRTTPYLATVTDDRGMVAAAVRTPPFRVIVYSALGTDPRPLNLILDDLIAFTAETAADENAGSIAGVTGHSDTALAFASAWSERTGRTFKRVMNERIYELRQVNPPTNVPGHLRPARDEELDLLAGWIEGFCRDAGVSTGMSAGPKAVARRYLDGGGVFFWEHEGQPVAMAARSRNSSRGIAVSLVYTPPQLRGRGYASACVAALSQQLLDAGWEFCTLYTDLANPTSNSIYQRIGYRPVCDADEYDFEGWYRGQQVRDLPGILAGREEDASP